MFKFHLKKGQTGNKLFWERKDVNPYSNTILQDITDENIEDVTVPLTSIPSPFARLQLFDTAFEFITKSKKIVGNSPYHKLVSDCLDVYEILFRIDELHLRDRIEFVKWTPSDLDVLTDDHATTGEKLFAETIKLHIERYNDDISDKPFSQIFIILLDHKPIAGTSPFTGFFTTSNSIDFQISYYAKRKFFCDQPQPLHLRDEDFQEFLNLFLISQRLMNRFKGLNDYVVSCRDLAKSDKLKELFRSINKPETLQTIDHYQTLEYKNNPLYVLPGIAFRKKAVKEEDFIEMVQNSDYLAITSKKLSQPPLILKDGMENVRWKYLKDRPLPKKLALPAGVGRINYEERVLPETSKKYPFLLEDDILSDYIIELDYSLNNDKFFTGADRNPKNGYLLPIKQDYFKFFTLEDLKKQLKIEVYEKESGNEYSVKIQIPVQAEDGKGKITFEKKYLTFENIASKPNDKGAVVKSTIFMGFYPFIKIGDLDDKTHELKVNRYSKYNDFFKTFIYYEDIMEIDCQFFKYSINSADLKSIPSNEFQKSDGQSVKSPSRTRKSENYKFITDYYELSNCYETNQDILSRDLIERDITYNFISLKINRPDVPKPIEAMIIPMMTVLDSSKIKDDQSYVSIDIGTTNTFVAFASNQNNPRTFTTRFTNPVLGLDELQMVMLHKPLEPYEDIKGSDRFDLNVRVGGRYVTALLNEFMPSLIEAHTKYRFPIVTAICWDNDVNISNAKALSILSNVNIPFAYFTKQKRSVDIVSTNLKWNISTIQSQSPINQLSMFVQQLVIMSRNMVIANGFNPESTKLIWFRPLSMSTSLSASFEDIWKRAYNLYFSKASSAEEKESKSKNNLKMISESVAPFFIIKPDDSGRYFLNIDIGGGTTDLVVYGPGNDRAHNEILLTSSVRFGGNSIFGNGLDHTKFGKLNGIVEKYTPIILETLEEQGDERLQVLNNFISNENLKSEDLINFFFTIDRFSDDLKKDADLKIAFLLHCGAIFYHTAQLMKSQGFGIPEYIGLSGNGSKIVEIPNLSSDLNREGGIAKLVTAIFEHVFSQKQPVKLTSTPNPKQVTSYGGIKGFNQIKENFDTFMIPLGDGQTVYPRAKARQIEYSTFFIDTDDRLQAVANNVIEFYNLFFDTLWKSCDFTDNFGVSKELDPKKLKNSLTSNQQIVNCLRNGIIFRSTHDGEREMNETLFFYPIIFDLFVLTKKLSAGGKEFK